MPDDQSGTRNYRAARRGLLDLHALSVGGLSESTQADAIREAMEDVWRSLSEIEKRRIEGLSKDLYAVEETSIDPHPSDPIEFTELTRAAAEGRCDEALESLRAHEKRASAARVSYLRGTIWNGAGDPVIALVFLEHAVRLNPSDPAFQAAYLNVLRSIDLGAA